MSSSERCERSSNWFGELNGDWCPRVAVSIGRCVRFLFLTVCQRWVVGFRAQILGALVTGKRCVYIACGVE